MTLGENIRQIRQEKNLTQQQLGSLCKPPMADSAIRRYEANKVNPKLETVQKIADALGVSVSSLIADRFDTQIEAFIQDNPNGTLTHKGLYSTKYIDLIKERLSSIGYPFMIDSEGNAWISFPDGYLLDFSENDLIEFMEDADSYLKFRLEELRKKKKQK